MAWIIENKTDWDLTWSNEDGWCKETFDTFTDEERDTLNLPIDGVWVRVPWSVGD
jgi:hypothetical protein